MTRAWWGGKLVMLGTALAISTPVTFHAAEAARTRYHGAHSAAAIHAGISRARLHYAWYGRSVAHRGWGGTLQCVPFARENTGIELTGNANTWWSQAEGIYQRGAKPEVGSILNFRATDRMRMGHVAVVANVLDSRRIEIDHANWGGPGRVSRNTEVVDVSPNNDWTAVRVALSHSDEYGSVYPTYGFIYDRPDRGTMVASAGGASVGGAGVGAASAAVTPAPIEAAAAAEPEEVAEAVDDAAPRYSRHRSFRHGRLHFAGANGHAAPRASVYRVSSRSSAPKSHTRRHRS